MGPRAAWHGPRRVSRGPANPRGAGGQGDEIRRRRRGRGAGRRRVRRPGPLGVPPPDAHAFLALTLDLELDSPPGGWLEGHGRVEQEAEEEGQERAMRPHALILPRYRAAGSGGPPSTPFEPGSHLYPGDIEICAFP